MRNSITPRLFSLSSALPGCMFEGVGSSPFAHRGVLGAMVPESTGVGDGAVGGREEIQALERTQPVLPMGLGYVEGVTHDYVRHGTTTLFAARNVANGQVMSRVRTQHRHQEFLDFLHQIDQQTPPELDLHLIVANTSRTSAAKTRPGAGPRSEEHTSELQSLMRTSDA